MTRGFISYHPLINFLFFVGALGFGMMLSHPIFSLCALVIALCEYLLLNRGKNKKSLLWYCVIFLMVLIFNALLNPLGETILFCWLNNRPVTLEAIIYGGVVGMNFAAVMLWFNCYNYIMTTDKFTYLFGRFVPSITLVLTMILRLIPLLQKKTKNIVSARNCIGKSKKGNGFKDALQSGMEVLSILTSCALEDAVITADSMRSRGFVDQKHSSYLFYRWEIRDCILLGFYMLCSAVLIVSIGTGAVSVQYFPTIVFSENRQVAVLGLIAYGLFLVIPIFVDLSEDIKWHILKSKI